MINVILYILEYLPYRTRFGLSLADELKYFYYYKIGQFKNPKKCLCGGKIRTYGWTYPEGWTTECNRCNLLIDED